MKKQILSALIILSLTLIGTPFSFAAEWKCENGKKEKGESPQDQECYLDLEPYHCTIFIVDGVDEIVVSATDAMFAQDRGFTEYTAHSRGRIASKKAGSKKKGETLHKIVSDIVK